MINVVSANTTGTDIKAWLSFATLAAVIYASWLFPGSAFSAACAILSSLFLAFLSVQKNSRIRLYYFSGVLVNLFGFNWLYETIQKFGGFSPIIAWPIFLFFVFVSALQFSLFAWLLFRLPRVLGVLRLPLAWVSAEFVFPRIFPWELSHPLLGLPWLAQIADVAGSPLVSFILLLISSSVLSVWHSPIGSAKLRHAILCTLLFFCWLGYGAYRVGQFTHLDGVKFSIAVVQANLAEVQKGDVATVKENKQSYLQLSRQLQRKPDLIVWPEGILQDWTSVDLRRVEEDPRVPYFGADTALLAGALTFKTQKIFFNSAILVDRFGAVSAPYHKRVLMPFGEYMPFSNIFPWLNEINANLALFTAGDKTEVMKLPLAITGQTVSISPLICYEDLIPSLAREAVQQGAQVLFNLTNDVWFGKSLAASHHHLMASYRAIENRRYLVRSTNTGLTAIVNPIGKTVASLAPFSDGTLEYSVTATDSNSLFSDFLGTSLWWFLCPLSCLIALFNSTNPRGRKKST